MAMIGPLLQQRRFEEARPLLETLLQLQPEHPEALYNLGVLASEEGELEEARLLLRRAVVANAGDAHAQANAQVALGLAALRQEDRAEARQALEAEIQLEPHNAFALRSIWSLLVIAGALAAGAERFRQALAVAPDDLITTCNLAQALLELDPDEHRDEADRLLLRVIKAQPYSELAAKAKDLRGSIASRDLRAKQSDGVAAGRRELLPPGPADVRGDGAAALHGGAQRGGRRRPGRATDQRAGHLPQSQDPSRQLERPGPGLPDPRVHEAADAG